MKHKNAPIIRVSKASGHPSYIMILLAMLLALTSCGYRLSGTGILVPQGTRTIAVPIFINSTNEPYVDVEITQALVEEFMADGRLKVTALEGAELALRGTVKKYEVSALSFTENSYVQQYKVRLVVDAGLEDLRTKKVLWQEQGIEVIFIADYPVSYDTAGMAEIMKTRIAKQAAIKKASQDLAWTLRSRVLEGF